MRSRSIGNAGANEWAAAGRSRIGTCRAFAHHAAKTFVALWAVPLSAVATEPPAPRQAELLHMLRHDCGACHGLRLDGGLGPPLTTAALARYAPEVLEQMILEGRAGTPMPPWKALLSPADVRWMVHAIRSGKAGE
jgi:cytochrome c55X